MTKITLSVKGMMCGHCEAHMNDAIRNNFKIKKVTSSHKDKETVIIAEDDIADEQLRAAVEDTGYELISISREEYKKKGLFG